MASRKERWWATTRRSRGDPRTATIPDGEPAAGAWGRCAAGRPTHAKAWSGRTVVAAASPGAQPLAGSAARRRRLGHRTGDVACRAGGAGLSVSPAHDSKRQAGADEDDGRSRL